MTTQAMAARTGAILFALLVLPAPAPGGVAQAQKPDPWQPIRVLAGDWEGTAEGESGSGTVKRWYAFVLRARFLHERNLTTYPPQEKNKAGEVHEHWSFFSYDNGRRRLVLRQFHQEGFVNRCVMNAEASTSGKVIFDSEAFENFSNA
jgi:hypothetical protein